MQNLPAAEIAAAVADAAAAAAVVGGAGAAAAVGWLKCLHTIFCGLLSSLLPSAPAMHIL